MDFKNFMNILGLIQKQPEKDPMEPKYIKPDGTKVIEQKNDFGTVVYEICPNKTLISRTYTNEGVLFVDYIRRGKVELGHAYNENGDMHYKYESVYDNKNNLVEKIETEYNYHENGVMSREYIKKSTSIIHTEILYDEDGNRTEKIEHNGTVKTYFDNNDKPYKRVIDRGAGGIISEDL